MIWKFPSRLPSMQPSEINSKDMEEVNKDQLKSTYQSDFTGIPQGEDLLPYETEPQEFPLIHSFDFYPLVSHSR